MTAVVPVPNVLRTLLFVPGNRPERFDKAAASGADAVVLDLEDAVPGADKTTARDAVRGWLRKHAGGSGPLTLVRINARGTPWFVDDVAVLREIACRHLMLPKCEQSSELHGLLDFALWPLIETAHGLTNAATIGAVRGVERLVFGSLDFQLDLGMDADAEETELAPYRAQVVLASRLAGLPPPVDGVTVAWNDDVRLTTDTRRAMRQGFGAKLCIHPRQIPVVHEAMRPADAELAEARRILDAAQAAGGAAVALDGSMVDRPVMLRAQAVVARASHARGATAAPAPGSDPAT
jgi:citrate lyase subunit beta/citryl-CoA lyase